MDIDYDPLLINKPTHPVLPGSARNFRVSSYPADCSPDVTALLFSDGTGFGDVEVIKQHRRGAGAELTIIRSLLSSQDPRAARIVPSEILGTRRQLISADMQMGASEKFGRLQAITAIESGLKTNSTSQYASKSMDPPDPSIQANLATALIDSWQPGLSKE